MEKFKTFHELAPFVRLICFYSPSYDKTIYRADVFVKGILFGIDFEYETAVEILMLKYKLRRAVNQYLRGHRLTKAAVTKPKLPYGHEYMEPKAKEKLGDIWP